MNRSKIYLLFLFGIIVFSACQSSPNQKLSENIKKSAAKLISDKAEEKVLLIYDYNEELSGLEYRPVTLQKASGNQLKDVLYAFFENNHFIENLDRTQLLKIVKEKDETTLYLAEINDQNTKNSRFFKKALELTMARNLSGNNFKVVLN